jgi:hypothetical protein
VAIFLLLFCPTGLILAVQWGGNAGSYLVSTQTDSTRTALIDQQYSLNLTASLLPAVDYYGALRFRHTQTRQSGRPTPWSTELAPSIGALWSSSFFRLRGGYEVRDLRNRDKSGNLTSHSLNTDLQSVWKDLPALRLSYREDQNNNDLDLLGLDTRQTNFAGQLDYQLKSTRINYEYRSANTVSRGSGFEQNSTSHTARVENGLNLLRRAVDLRTSYQVTARSEKTTLTAGQTILVALPAAQGLYLADPSPDFNHLESAEALIDGNLSVAASALMDLSGQSVQNFGLDFGAPIAVDHLFLYTDTLANPDLGWAVYLGADNQNWTLAQSARVFSFNQFFYRYEIDFPRQTARYIKIVCQAEPRPQPVHVTELRAFTTQPDDNKPDRTTDHRATARLGIRPLSWVTAAVDGTLLRVDAGSTQLRREQDGVTSSLTLSPSRLVSLSGQYQFGRTAYPGQSNSHTDTDLTGVSLISQWMASLRSTLSASRRREVVSGQTIRRLDAVSARLDTRLLPAVNGSTDLGFSRDHQYLTDNQTDSRYVTQSLNVRPTPRSLITAGYYYYRYTSRRGLGPSSRETVNLSASYRLTSAVSVQGALAALNEPGRRALDWNAGMGWMMTPKLFVNSTVQRIVPAENRGTVTWNSQATFQWSARVDLNASYSYLYSYRTSIENQTLLHVGMNLAF